MQRDIKFHPIFGLLMRDGVKTCTSRSEHQADEGDTFNIFGMSFRVTHVIQNSLGLIRNGLFYEEGAMSPGHFEEIYRSVGRHRPFDPDKIVWVHHFKRVS